MDVVFTFSQYMDVVWSYCQYYPMVAVEWVFYVSETWMVAYKWKLEGFPHVALLVFLALGWIPGFKEAIVYWVCYIAGWRVVEEDGGEDNRWRNWKTWTVVTVVESSQEPDLGFYDARAWPTIWTLLLALS